MTDPLATALELPYAQRGEAVLDEAVLAWAAELDDLALQRAKARMLGAGCASKAWDRLVQERRRRRVAVDPDESQAWEGDLRRSEEGRAIASWHNAGLILRNWGPFRSMRLNELTLEAEVDGQPMTDGDAHRWLERIERRFGVALSRELFDSATEAVAEERRYHPHRARLEALTWDGTPRFASLASEVLDCHDPLAPRMLQCFLVGSVARTYCPGSKVDTILTLFSARQGRKKTLFFSSLFYGSVYAGYIDTRDKDTVLCANTSLCTLIDEVDEFTTRSEWPAVKRWVSEPESTFRAPYARRPRKWPRRFVIGATTNRDDILRDETGSRRWHILSVGPKGIDTRTDRLIEMRDQLWAEAKEVYLGGTMQCTREPTPYLWWLTPEEEERREAGAKNYEERTIIDEKVDAYVRGLALRPVRLQDVLEHALGVEHAELGRDGRLEHRAAAALRRAGYESRGGRAGRVWTHRDAPTQLEVAT